MSRSSSSSAIDSARHSAGILTVPLDGFGLTDYETRAYVALLRGGTLTGSQLATFSQIPRCKVYSVIASLKGKGLVEIEKGSPIRCRAIPPEEVLEQAVLDEEKRVRGMRRAVAKLKRLRDEARQPARIEEGRYLILGPQAVASKLRERISLSRKFVHCVVDPWGCRVLEQISDSIVSAVIAGEVDFRVILKWEFDVDWTSIKLPVNVQVRVAKLRVLSDTNLFCFDDGGLMVVDGKSGGGISFSIPKLNSIVDNATFHTRWESSIPLTELLSIMRVRAAEEIFGLADKTEVNRLFLTAVANSVKDEGTIAEIGEQYLQLVSATTTNLAEDSETALALLTALLSHDLGEDVQVRFDTMTGMLTVDATDSKVGMRPSPWLFAIIALSKRSGATVKIFPEASSTGSSKGLGCARIVQVKLSVPLTV